MRDIKFRVWDKRINQMLKTWVMDFRPGLSAVDKYIMVQNEWPTNGGPAKEPWGNTRDHLELMQFTGLHDNNGKEIYEGDIIRHTDEICEVRWMDKKACFSLIGPFHMIDMMTLSDLHKSNMEVIGNIYQNPELTTP